MVSLDEDALIALYRSTGGKKWFKSWHKKKNWGSSAKLSTWYGVEVNQPWGQVIKLSLRSNNLKGTTQLLLCKPRGICLTTETCCCLRHGTYRKLVGAPYMLQKASHSGTSAQLVGGAQLGAGVTDPHLTCLRRALYMQPTYVATYSGVTRTARQSRTALSLSDQDLH